MAKNKGVLGRGLGALLSGNATAGETDNLREDLPNDDGRSVGTICKIDIAKVSPNPFQPRVDFNPQALEELKLSILEHGVIQPITVRRIGDRFELISGERRVRASIDANLTDIPAYILDINSDRGMLAIALIENVQRENLNPIEIALGYQRLIKECSLTQEDVADKVGKDRSTVTNMLRLLRLPQQVQGSLRDGEISMGHARALLTIQDVEGQLKVWNQVREEGLSVRKTEAIVKQVAQSGASRKEKKKAATTNGIATPSPTRTEFDLTLTEISARLRQVFGTQVKVKSNAAGDGNITIDFYNSEDLERLLELFAVIERHGR
ncbi:MAG: ParB/RepB/Spo0J family partition protein [Armatimonadetes bacterium]|nr:ParB/RepB/Spo0J family partition protein [Armatimonadota bacterium]